MNEVYEVQYKAVDSDKWEFLNGVVADKVEFPNTPHPIKSFLLADKTVIDFPLTSYVFKYGPIRQQRLDAELEASQAQNVQNYVDEDRR